MSPRPNIVVIIADDLGWNDVGAFGHPHIQTPNIDRLASAGMKFNQAFLTTSSCSPSRASILTGRYPHNTGAMHLHQPLPAGEVIFPAILKSAGYYTAAIGKWHLGSAARAAYDSVIDTRDQSGAADWIDGLRNRPKNRPFFFWLASLDPHRPYHSEQLIEKHQPSDAWIPPFMIDTDRTRAELTEYYNEIARLDENVGQVLRELERQNVLDNTLILFLSDNGRPFHRAKTSLYDSGIKTPLIAVWNGLIPPGSENDQLVSSIDIAATILEVAGAPELADIPARSFAGAFADPDWQGRNHIFAEHNWHGRDAHERAVRSRDFLYIQNQWPPFGYCHRSQYQHLGSYQDLASAYKRGQLSPDLNACFAEQRPREELYDVRRDPYSLANLVDDSKYRESLDRLRNFLSQWRTTTEDPDYTPYRPAIR